MRIACRFILGAIVVCSLSVSSKTIKVPQDYAKIQLAINAAVNGDTVLVDEGTYTENIVITKKIVLGSLYIADNNMSHISNTILNGSTPRHADSASVVTIDGATDTTTIVAGFTITGGKGNVRVATYPVILTYRVGTGIDVAGGGATIRKNTIVANNLTTSGRASGAVNIWDAEDVNGISLVVVEDNTIADNTLVGSSVEGCALAVGHSARIMHNRILRNVATGTSAGLAAAAQIWNGTVRFENNFVAKNSASHWGGALFVNPYGSVIPGTSMTLTLVNNIIANNSAGVGGGALWVEVAEANVLSINNTIVGNTSPAGAGLYIKDTAHVKAINTILWNSGSADIFLATGGTASMSYSNVRGGLTGTGNINVDPQFVANDTMYRLTSDSPCINKGVNSATVGGIVLTAPFRDYFGTVRPQNSTPDLGAVEDGSWTSVNDNYSNYFPTDFSLSQNYPNPFNPSTTIRYSLPSSAHVKLTVYNMLGQVVSELVNEKQTAGWKEMQWNASGFASGMYLVRMQAGNFVQVKKILLMK